MMPCLFFQEADDQFNTSDSFSSAPKSGNHVDSNRAKGSLLDEDIKMENEECSVSGLINSYGEEENCKPVIIGKWQLIRIDQKHS